MKKIIMNNYRLIVGVYVVVFLIGVMDTLISPYVGFNTTYGLLYGICLTIVTSVVFFGLLRVFPGTISKGIPSHLIKIVKSCDRQIKYSSVYMISLWPALAVCFTGNYYILIAPAVITVTLLVFILYLNSVKRVIHGTMLKTVKHYHENIDNPDRDYANIWTKEED